ncbi:MAG: carbohydrate ABC transporter permease [Christensenellales bacterium]
MKQKKCITITAVCALVLAVAFFAAAALFNDSKDFKTGVLSGTGDITTIESDGNDIVYASSEGYFVRPDSDKVETKISDSRVLFLFNTQNGMIAVDETQKMMLLSRDGSVEKQTELPALYLACDFYEGKYYVATSTNYSNLIVCRYDENFNLEQTGRLYFYNDDSLEMELANISLYGFFVRNGKIFVFGDSGQIVILPTDMSGFTRDEEEFFDSGVETLKLNCALKSVANDDENGRFFLAGKDRGIYVLDYDGAEISDKPITKLDKDIALLTYGAQDDVLAVFYDLFDDVTILDAQTGSVQSRFTGVFNLKNAKISADGETLYTFSKDGSDYVLNAFSLDAVSKAKTLGVFRSIFVILACLMIVTALVCAGMLIRIGKTKKPIEGKAILRDISKHKFIYIILCPSIILLFLFCYYPSVASMVMAFFDYRSGYPVIFNGFENFRVLFSNPLIGDAIRNMFIFLVCDIVLGVIPPIIFAWSLVVMKSKKFSSMARTLLFIPGIIPGIAGILIWKEGIYGTYGLLNTVLKYVFNQEPVAFLGDERYSMLSIIMMGFPFVGSYLIFYGALANVPQAYYEAAELDGCGVFRRIISIDIPFVSPQMKYVFVMCFIGSVQNVSRIMMTTQGAAGTQIPIYMMYNYLSDNNYGVSSAMALILFVVLMVATFFNMKINTADTEL